MGKVKRWITSHRPCHWAVTLLVVCGIGLWVSTRLIQPNPPAVPELASLAQILKANNPVLSQPSQRIKFEQLTVSLEAKARSDPAAPYWVTWEWLNQLTLFLHSPHTVVFFKDDSPSVFPIAFYWTSNGLAASAFPPGGHLFPDNSQVVSLGGLTPERLLSRLKAVMAGNSYWVRRAGGPELAYPYLLHWIGAIGPGGVLHLTLREPDGQITSVSVQALAPPFPASRLVALRAWFLAHLRIPLEQSPNWYINRAHGYGVFRIPAMTLSPALQTDLRAFFTAVKKSGLDRVLIDVRRDPGGNSCVTNAVAAYLPNGASVIGPQCGTVPFSTAGLVFSGHVFVAQGWSTFSSAAVFASDLSRLPDVTLIGAPTGGSPSGDMGNIATFHITASPHALFGQVGTTQICSPPAPTWAGVEPSPVAGGCSLIEMVMPQVSLPLTMADLRANVDPVIQWMNTQP